MRQNHKVLAVFCIITFTLSGCSAGTSTGSLLSVTSGNGFTSNESVDPIISEQIETSTLSETSASNQGEIINSEKNASTGVQSKTVTSTSTSTVKKNPTPTTAANSGNNIPVINSPFKSMEYIDCTYAYNCPEGEKCHILNASIMYDPVSKKVICMNHFVKSFFNPTHDISITGPVGRTYLLNDGKFVVNVSDMVEYPNINNAYLVNVRNNTIEKLPYSFRNVTRDFKWGVNEYWLYNIETGDTKELTYFSGDSVCVDRLSPSGKFVLGYGNTKDKPNILYNVQNGVAFSVEKYYNFFDDERYVISNVRGVTRIYDTATGKDVTKTAKVANPYYIECLTRYNAVTNEAVKIPNINQTTTRVSSTSNGYLYTFQNDGYLYRTEITTLKQVKFLLPDSFRKKITNDYNKHNYDMLILDIDEKTNRCYFFVFYER